METKKNRFLKLFESDGFGQVVAFVVLMFVIWAIGRFIVAPCLGLSGYLYKISNGDAFAASLFLGALAGLVGCCFYCLIRFCLWLGRKIRWEIRWVVIRRRLKLKKTK